MTELLEQCSAVLLPPIIATRELIKLCSHKLPNMNLFNGSIFEKLLSLSMLDYVLWTMWMFSPLVFPTNCIFRPLRSPALTMGRECILCLSTKATGLMPHTLYCQSLSENPFGYPFGVPLCGLARLNYSASLTHSDLFQSVAKIFRHANQRTALLAGRQ